MVLEAAVADARLLLLALLIGLIGFEKNLENSGEFDQMRSDSG